MLLQRSKQTDCQVAWPRVERARPLPESAITSEIVGVEHARPRRRDATRAPEPTNDRRHGAPIAGEDAGLTASEDHAEDSGGHCPFGAGVENDFRLRGTLHQHSTAC